MQSPGAIVAQSDLFHRTGGPDLLRGKRDRGCRQVSLPATDAGSLQVDDMRLTAVGRHYRRCPGSQSSRGGFKGNHNGAAYKAIKGRWTKILAQFEICSLHRDAVQGNGIWIPAAVTDPQPESVIGGSNHLRGSHQRIWSDWKGCDTHSGHVHKLRRADAGVLNAQSAGNSSKGRWRKCDVHRAASARRKASGASVRLFITGRIESEL